MIGAGTSHGSDPFVRLLLCLVVILALGKLVGMFCRKIGQPVVIGEILAGILLGPTLLGAMPGDLDQKLFPIAVVPFLRVVASLGLVLFMFIVGLEVDMDVIRRSGKRAIVISLTSIAFPFVLGMVLLAPYLSAPEFRCVTVEAGDVSAAEEVTPECSATAEVSEKSEEAQRKRTSNAIDERHAAEAKAAKSAGQDYTVSDDQKALDAAEVDQAVENVDPSGRPVSFLPFAMFIGVSMCGTAFAVLARILAERDMFKIPLGILLVACAAIDDIVAFTLLALATAVASGAGPVRVVVMLAELALFVAALYFIARPVLERFVVSKYRETGKLAPEQLAILLMGLLISAYITSKIGVHELIGAFLYGTMVPRRNVASLFHAIADRLEGVSVQLLLPVFFVIAGQKVNILGLDRSDILPTLAILTVACIGKFVGGAVAARFTGVPRRQSLAVGTMMNTRGLAELVILQVGLEAGVINDKVYTMLVIMAIVTTVMAGPLLKIVYPDKWLERDIAEAARQGAGEATDRAVVLVADPAEAEQLVDLAVAFGGARPTSSVTLVRFVPSAGGFGAVADALGETQALRRRVEAAGVGCTVVSRASDDPDGDTVSEVLRLAPDAVIAGPVTRDLIDRLTSDGTDVVVVQGALDVADGVAAPGGHGNDDLAALELATRLALHYDVALQVAGEGGRVGRQLRSLGVHRGTGGAVISARTGPGPVVVYAGQRDRITLTDRLSRWRVGDVVEPLSSR